MADNLKKQGSYVPGIRPGEQTKKYITKVLYRLTLWFYLLSRYFNSTDISN